MITKNQVKYIQSLGQKKSRDEDNCFIAEGPKIVSELLKADNVRVLQVYANDEWVENNSSAEAEVIAVNADELKKISHLSTPNQVVAIAQKIKWEGEPTVKGEVSLMLDDIQDPGNLGTIVRLADWFGIKNIICSNETADVYNPKVVQATMGSMLRVRLTYTNLMEFLKQYVDVRVYGAMLDGRDVTKMEKIREGIIVIGNESKGIGDKVSFFVNARITIPKKGQAESLNAAVATGIIISHLVS